MTSEAFLSSLKAANNWNRGHMPSAEFERSLQATRAPDECWRVLIDVERLASWVSVVGEVFEEKHLETYRAVLVDQFGPFKLKADLYILVTNVDEGRSIAFRAKGEDRQVATSIVMDGSLALEPAEAGTIRKKADAIMEEFFAAAAAALG